MAQVSWEIGDPLVERFGVAKDAAGFWNVAVTVQESAPGSLGTKVVKVKLKSHGKDVAQSLWPVSGDRPEGGVAKTTLTFVTGLTTYPENVKLEIELTEK
ncbi:MAG: hypothetical protein A2Y72_04340 [Chloroflexi bacterium RBG_13_53_26]|nr:MAG: hypothetical protein A2Y72_04340 [Chloroflexi bacterium RBG_13_53_26]